MILKCYNNLKFSGEITKVKEAINYAKEYLKLIATDIEIPYKGSLSYLTSVEPNITGIKRIALQFNLDFGIYYDSKEGKMIGDVTYKDGQLTITELDSAEYEQIKYNEQTKLYSFRGGYASDNNKFLLMLLLEKVLRNL